MTTEQKKAIAIARARIAIAKAGAQQIPPAGEMPTEENVMAGGAAPQYLTREYLSPMETAIETIPMVSGMVGSLYGPGGAMLLGSAGEIARQMITGEADLNKVLMTGATEGLLTKGGDYLGRAIQRFTGTPSGTPGIQETREAQETLQQGGGTLTGVQAGSTGIGAVAEQVSRGTLLGRGAFEQLEERNVKALATQVDDLVTARTGRELSLEETARGVVDAIETGYDSLKAGYDSVTTQIWSQVPGALDGVAVKQSIDNTLQAQTRSVGGDPSAIGANYARVVSTLRKLPDNPTAKEVNENLQLLRGIQRGLEKEPGANTIELQRISKLIDDAEDGFAQQLQAVDPQLLVAFKDAQKKYGKYKNELFPKLLTGAMKSASKDAFQTIGLALTKPNVSLDQIKAAKIALKRAGKLNRSLDVDAALSTMQESYIRGLFGTPQSLNDMASVSTRLLGKNGRAQREAMKELLGPGQYSRVIAIANAAKRATEGAKGSGVLQLSVGSRQVGAVETLAGGGAVTSLITGDPSIALYSAGILLAPAFIAKVATSPTMTNRLIAILSRQRPMPAIVAEQLVTRMVFELGMDANEFRDSTGVDLNTLQSRLDDLRRRKREAQESAFKEETLAPGP